MVQDGDEVMYTEIFLEVEYQHQTLASTGVTAKARLEQIRATPMLSRQVKMMEWSQRKQKV